jgi:hypothetical protein
MNYGRIIMELTVDRRSMEKILDMFNFKVKNGFVEIDGEKYLLENVEVKINYCEEDDEE